MLVRYGKSIDALVSVKGSMVSENDALQKRLDQIAEAYVRQPRREDCKNCTFPLGENAFCKRGVEYAICKRCGHLNGRHEDTDAFCELVYTSNEGGDYAASYVGGGGEAYRARVEAIYRPKAEFLFEGIKQAGDEASKLRFADLGAGSGYFVSALNALGVPARGFDVSRTQAEFARVMSPGVEMQTHELEEAVEIARTVEADVASMVGVLEHVQRPRETLAAIAENPSVRYLYLSLPLFSPSVAIEAVFPEVMQRHLAGGHTHLYTESSIRWFSKEFGFASTAEWWFGTDVMDLFRSVEVMLRKKGDSEELLNLWRETMLPKLDDLQLVLDRQQASSEVHILLKKI